MSDTAPKLGDTDNTLLFKIAQALASGSSGGGAVSSSDISSALGFLPVPATRVSVYAAGTGHEVTESGGSLVDFSVTDPILTFSEAGTYQIRARIRLDAESLTIASGRTLAIELSRILPAPFISVPNSPCEFIISPKTAVSETVAIIELPDVFFAVTAGVKLQLQASLDSNVDSGALRIVEASITAIRVL